MPTGIKVKDAMIKEVVTTKPSQTVFEGAKLMEKGDVGSIIICENYKPVGIVTREDIVNKIVAKNVDASKTLLKDVMTKEIVSCSSTDDLRDVAHKMSKHGYERIPVIDSGKLVGIISTREIAKVAPQEIEILRERLLINEPGQIPEEEFSEGECELCGNFSAELRNVNDRWVCVNCKEEAEEI